MKTGGAGVARLGRWSVCNQGKLEAPFILFYFFFDLADFFCLGLAGSANCARWQRGGVQ